MSNILNNLIIVIIIVIIIICFIVGFKIKEGITCDTSQFSVLDMSISDYNCMSTSNTNIPQCIPGQQLIINAPNNVYRCATVYGNPVQNTCNINTNNVNNYIITCDGYSSQTSTTTVVPNTNNNTTYYYTTPAQQLQSLLTDTTNNISDPTITDTTTTQTYTDYYPDVYTNPPTQEQNTLTDTSNNIPDPTITDTTTTQTYTDYSPFLYPKFTEPTYNLVSTLIINPATSSETQTTSSNTTPASYANSYTYNNSTMDISNTNPLLPHSNIPSTRVTEGTKATSGIKKQYVFESVPFPYLPPFTSF